MGDGLDGWLSWVMTEARDGIGDERATMAGAAAGDAGRVAL